VPGTSILLIALAFTLGQWLLAFWSIFALSRISPMLGRSLARPLFHGALATLCGGVATYGVLYLEGGIAPLTTLLAVFAEGLVAGIVGLAVSAGVLALLKNEEFMDLVRALARFSALRRALSPSAVETTLL
jgi:hypothetical protein